MLLVVVFDNSSGVFGWGMGIFNFWVKFGLKCVGMLVFILGCVGRDIVFCIVNFCFFFCFVYIGMGKVRELFSFFFRRRFAC